MLSSSISSVRRLVVSVAPARRFLSTTAAVTAPPQHTIRVVSRRVWQAHKETLPKKPKPKGPTNVDEKPWPLNFKIAGAVAAATLIPYFSVWFICSDPALREFFKDYLPLDKLRWHFGENEWNATSYVDSLEHPIDVNLKTFPLELPYQTRKEQGELEKLENGNVSVQLILLDGASQEQTQPTKQVPGSTKATPDTLLNVFGNHLEQGGSVAVEFIDEHDSGGDAIFADAFSNTENNNSTTSSLLSLEDPTAPLLQRTHTFSTWHFQPQAQSQQQQVKTSKRMTDEQVEMSRLEYTIDKLQNDLNDPNCTRDIDSLREELNQAKKALSRSKWKNRLGL
jgi:hypothetical protein